MRTARTIIEARPPRSGEHILRDLFNGDDGGWLQDSALLDRLVKEKLDREADAIRAEGWKWVETSPDFPYGHTYDLRRLVGEQRPLTEEETAAHDALRAELDKLEETYAEVNGIPEEVDQRLSEIETALAVFEERPVVYDPDEISRAGAFVSIDGSGALRIERGYVRPEDEPPAVPSKSDTGDGAIDETGPGAAPAPDDDPVASVDPELRFHPRCFYRADDNARRETMPALLAAVTDLDGTITGVHRTWLARDGADVLAAGEGIETVLSLRCALPRLPMLAALSANHLAALTPSLGLRRLYIARDNDDAGRHAAEALSGRVQANGIEVLVLTPTADDFNTDLRLFGRDALAHSLRVQLA